MVKPAASWPRFCRSSSIRGISRETCSGPDGGASGEVAGPGEVVDGGDAAFVVQFVHARLVPGQRNWEIHDAADLAGFNPRIIGVGLRAYNEIPEGPPRMHRRPHFIKQTKTKSSQLVGTGG